MQVLKTLLGNTLHLFYPHVCTGCGSDLLAENNLLCLRCINELPNTNFAIHPGNPIEKIFWGRIPVTAAHSQFYFSKESLIQHLIHQLKYKNHMAIGFYMGELMGNSLLQSGRFNTIDYLVPLPLYSDKEKKRGYNQATIICNGVSAAMQVPVLTGNVNRQRFTATQTRKHRTERWKNVEGSFIINNPDALIGKRILLVDDVITTGATLEACGSILTQIEGLQLYIASLAHAGK
ncbi:MAG: phosphoribosyltransferase family protein [Ferruginibacter sp.]